MFLRAATTRPRPRWCSPMWSAFRVFDGYFRAFEPYATCRGAGALHAHCLGLPQDAGLRRNWQASERGIHLLHFPEVAATNSMEAVRRRIRLACLRQDRRRGHFYSGPSHRQAAGQIEVLNGRCDGDGWGTGNGPQADGQLSSWIGLKGDQRVRCGKVSFAPRSGQVIEISGLRASSPSNGTL
jgi:hypothetical protein